MTYTDLCVCMLFGAPLPQDQIHHLSEAGIRAVSLTAAAVGGDWQAARQIQDDVRRSDSDVRLLFVTPEKVAKSDSLIRLLRGLHNEGRFKRVIVDEAHCEW